MSRPSPSLLIQAAAVPVLAAAVVLAFLIMGDQPQAAQWVVVLSLSYLLGSMSWGYMLLGWRLGLDIRNYGSGRTGMSNVLRTAGGKAAGAVLALDIAKGVLAVILAREIIGSNTAEVTASLIVLVGHNWSVFLRFQGGRGILTALGGLSMMTPVPAVLATATFLATAFLSRYISLGSIFGVIIGGLSVVGLALAGWYSETYMLYALVGGAMIIWQHRDNIKRIRQGNERRLGHPAAAAE
jgi:glycerol-3-phosphate acyltransferase PlsY